MLEILSALLAGTAAGMGAGGGALLVPLLTIALGYPLLQAQAAALVGFLPAAVMAVVVHARAKRLQGQELIWVFAGGLPGVGAGLLLTLWLQPQILRIFYGVLVLILAGYLLFTSIAKAK